MICKAQNEVAGYYTMLEAIDYLDLKPDSTFLKYNQADIDMMKIPSEPDDTILYIHHGSYLVYNDTIYLDYFSDSTLAIEKYQVIKSGNRLTGLCPMTPQKIDKIENSRDQLYAYYGKEGTYCFRKEMVYDKDQMAFRSASDPSKQYRTEPVVKDVARVIRDKKTRNSEWYYVSASYLIKEMKAYYVVHPNRKQIPSRP